MSLDSCELSNVGAGSWGAASVLTCSCLITAFFGFGATVVTTAFGAASVTSCLAGGGGVTWLMLLSWNGATSVVLGIAFLSRVPLPSWLSWARKSAFSGGFTLLKVDRVISRVLLICLGSTTLKPTPRSSARWISAARKSVKPSRSAGRTPARESSGGRSAGSVMTRKPTSHVSKARHDNAMLVFSRLFYINGLAACAQWHPSAGRRCQCRRRCRSHGCRLGW